MSIKIDVDKSTKARIEGNASFKKGRWTEAIGHYTTAIVFNPEDGLGYTNRAAAYLKIDKWKDAERDCSTALSLAKTQQIQPNPKALYRRSLARKALENIDGAIEDIEAVLGLEPTNETALEEKVELEDLRRKATTVQETKSQKAKTLPPSPPRPLAELPTTDPSPDEDATVGDLVMSKTTNPTPAAQLPASTSVSKSSFADLRKGRQAGRKAFASPITQDSSSLSSHVARPDRTDSPSTLPVSRIALDDAPPLLLTALEPPRSPLKSKSEIEHPTPPTSISTPSPTPLPLLDPLAPGSALALINSIRRYTPSATYPLLFHLSTSPSAIGRMLDNFLEPDQIPLILDRLHETLALEEAVPEVVRRFIAGMTQTKRWAMTAIMLSKRERALGQEVWERAGGEGDFTRRREV